MAQRGFSEVLVNPLVNHHFFRFEVPLFSSWGIPKRNESHALLVGGDLTILKNDGDRQMG
jgi:hypothetical protein